MRKSIWLSAIVAICFVLQASASIVGEGLQSKILSVDIGNDLRPVITYTLTDDEGNPLSLDDLGGDPRFIMSRIVIDNADKMMMHYECYTPREVSSSEGATALQGNYASGVNASIGGNRFTFTFNDPLPNDYDVTATHTVSAQIARSLDDLNFYANPVFHFVPDGSDVTVRKEISTTETCNSCHNGLGLHGGGRREYVLCIMCHNPQSTDPDSGNTVDMGVMIHKIHMGAELPSVQAGTPYQIIGYRNSVHDYSHVEFPIDHRDCEVCHTGPQADHWKTVPTRFACGSCHDDINWETGEGHSGGPATSDSMCAMCHPAEGVEFGLSVAGAHTVPTQSTSLAGLVADVVSVENGAPGQAPTVRFTLKNGDGSVVPLAEVSRVSLLLAGPTTDYSSYASESVSADSATLDGDVYVYTLTSTLPADAAGTYAVGIEARRSVTVNDESLNEAADNDVEYFSVDGSAILPRRTVVSLDTCNVCHGKLSLHGSLRNQTEYCVMCHNPNTTDIEVRPEDQLPPVSINFKDMIHKIHTGHELTTDYTVYGYRSSVHNYNEIGFPGDRKQCSICHVNDSHLLPLPDGVIATSVMQDDTLIEKTSPASAACLSCHDTADAMAHASLNTTPEGAESCAVCHGEGRNSAVSHLHQQDTFLAPQEPIVDPGTGVEDWMLSK